MFQLPTHAQWGSQQPARVSSPGTQSLLEIQQQEEIERRKIEQVFVFNG